MSVKFAFNDSQSCVQTSFFLLPGPDDVTHYVWLLSTCTGRGLTTWKCLQYRHIVQGRIRNALEGPRIYISKYLWHEYEILRMQLELFAYCNILLKWSVIYALPLLYLPSLTNLQTNSFQNACERKNYMSFDLVNYNAIRIAQMNIPVQIQYKYK